MRTSIVLALCGAAACSLPSTRSEPAQPLAQETAVVVKGDAPDTTAVADDEAHSTAVESNGDGETSVALPVALAPLQVAIIGASVSAGFIDGPLTGGSPDNRTVPLLKIARGWLKEVKAGIISRADTSMFMDATTKGAQQVERALRKAPDLVFAIDFLFWYGYGYVRFGGATEKEERTIRLARLEQGLALLDRFEGTLIVGDLPDMTGASRRMISPAQIPSEPSLQELNARIAAWTEERPHAHLFPLRRLVTTMKNDGVELPLDDGAVTTPPGSLLQGDRLHANRLGMAWLGYLLQDAAHQALPGERAASLPRWSMDQFVDLAGADVELEELQFGK